MMNGITISCLVLSLATFGCYPKAESVNHEKQVDQARKTGGIIYRSLDKGRMWSSFDQGIPENATVSGFQAKGNKLFATTDFHGVFVFLSGANQWQAINLGLPDQVDVNAITVLNDLLVIGTNKHGIFISRDDGRLWSQSNAGLPNIPVRSLISVKDNLYAGTDKGIYVSSDGGLHWRYQYGKVQVNGFTYVNEKIYAALVDGAIVSDDYGKSWKYIYKPNTLHDISNDGSFIYAMTLGADGLVRTNNDGRTWEKANVGFPGSKFYTFEVKAANQNLLAAQWHGIYQSIDRGDYWSRINTGVNGLPDSTAFMTLEVTDFGILVGTGLKNGIIK